MEELWAKGKGEGVKQDKLAVIKQPRGWKAQRGECSPQHCNNHVRRRVGARVTDGVPLKVVCLIAVLCCTPETNNVC